MKIRGIEIQIGTNQTPPALLGVIPLDLEVPEEFAKTDWMPLEVIVTVLTSANRSSGSIRLYSTEQDPGFRIDQNMIRAAVSELNKRIETQRVQLCSGEEGGRG